MSETIVGLVIKAEAEVTPGPDSNEEERKIEEARFLAEGPTKEEAE